MCFIASNVTYSKQHEMQLLNVVGFVFGIVRCQPIQAAFRVPLPNSVKTWMKSNIHIYIQFSHESFSYCICIGCEMNVFVAYLRFNFSSSIMVVLCFFHLDHIVCKPQLSNCIVIFKIATFTHVRTTFSYAYFNGPVPIFPQQKIRKAHRHRHRWQVMAIV